MNTDNNDYYCNNHYMKRCYCVTNTKMEKIFIAGKKIQHEIC